MTASMTSYHDIIPMKSFQSSGGPLKVTALSEGDKAEVLSFLSARPIHTVCMASFVRDNGVISPENRGTFYGCRDKAGALRGVALIGHATLFETDSDEALEAFAFVKHHFQNAHLVRGESETVLRFWNHYARLGHEPRVACQENLFVQRSPAPVNKAVPQLRPAPIDVLEELKLVNAHLIQSECGIDPLKRDPVGFSKRLARRIARNRVWVLEQDKRIIFKADVFAKTPEVAYLEGVFVDPEFRGRGIGLRCLQELSRRLLKQCGSVCLLINQREEALEQFYTKAGYERCGSYHTIYLFAEN